MAAELPTTTIRAAHEAILSTTRAAFGDAIRQYGYYQPLDDMGDPASGIQTPALMLELEGFEQEDDGGARGEARIRVRCTWAMHIWLGFTTPDLQVALPELASDVLILLRAREHDLTRAQRGNRWGLGAAMGYPELATATPAEFRPGIHGMDSWLIRWEQSLYLPLDFMTV